MKRRAFITLLSGWGLGAIQKQSISIATSRRGSIFHALGVGLARLLSAHLSGAQFYAEMTNGAVENRRLLEQGRVELALVMSDALANAPLGIKGLAVLYTSYLHVAVAADSGLRRITDLRGKRVSLGPSGSSTEQLALRLLRQEGLTPEDLRIRERLGPADAAAAVRDQKLDAMVLYAGIPVPAIASLAATQRITLLPHMEAAKKLVSAFGPVYSLGTIPKEAYRGLTADVPVISAKAVLVAHQRMDEAMAYGIVKALIENTEELLEAHRAAREITLRSAVAGSPIPFHPGAARYYREKGVL
jgi:uncharacterized protein